MKLISFRSQVFLMVVLALAAALSLVALRSSYQSGDSLTYAFAAEKGGPDMFHPHHLMFAPIVHMLTRVSSALSLTSDVIVVGQLHNIFWAIVVLLSLYVLARFFTGSAWCASGATAVLFATQGFLTFTTWLEVYTPALGALSVLAAAVITADPGRLKRGPMLLCLTVFSLAVLYHQTNVLFAVPLGVYFVLSESRRISDLAVLLFFSGAAVLTVYVVSYASISDSPSMAGFLDFCLAYVEHPNPLWGSPDNVGLTGLRSLLSSQIWNISAVSWGHEKAGRRLVALILITVFTWNIVQVNRGKKFRGERIFFLTWAAAYHLFFLWWLPSQQEFFLVTVFPVVMLGVITLHDVLARRLTARVASSSGTAVLAVAAFLLLTHNLPPVWEQRTSKGERFEKAREISRLVTGDLLVLTDYETEANLRFYFRHKDILETALPLLMFYQHREVPTVYQSAVSRRCLVELAEIDPSMDLMGFSGFSHPSDWFGFVEWLFRIEKNPDGDPVSCRTFEIMKDDTTGRHYILLGDDVQKVNGIADIFSRFDNAIQAAGGGGDPFSRWLEKQRVGSPDNGAVLVTKITCPVVRHRSVAAWHPRGNPHISNRPDTPQRRISA